MAEFDNGELAANPVAVAMRRARQAFLNRVPNAQQRIKEQLDAEAEARAAPLRAYNDAQAARLVGKSALIDQRLAARKALMNRNVANYQRIAPPPTSFEGAGSVTPEGIATRNLRNELTLQPGAADRLRRMQILNAAQAAPAQEAATPAALAMGHVGGMSEVGRGLDPQMAARIQAGFAARAERELKQGSDIETARKRRDSLAKDAAAGLQAHPESLYQQALAANKGRPSPASQRAARIESAMAMQDRINMMNAKPALAMAAIQFHQDPSKMLEQNYLKALIREKLLAQGIPPDEVDSHPFLNGGSAPQGNPPMPFQPYTPPTPLRAFGNVENVFNPYKAGRRMGERINDALHGTEYMRRKRILDAQFGPRVPGDEAKYNRMLELMMRQG